MHVFSISDFISKIIPPVILLSDARLKKCACTAVLISVIHRGTRVVQDRGIAITGWQRALVYFRAGNAVSLPCQGINDSPADETAGAQEPIFVQGPGKITGLWFSLLQEIFTIAGSSPGKNGKPGSVVRFEMNSCSTGKGRR